VVEPLLAGGLMGLITCPLAADGGTSVVGGNSAFFLLLLCRVRLEGNYASTAVCTIAVRTVMTAEREAR